MSKSAPSAPAPPDPNTVSAAQTKSNQQTALYNAGLNDVNQNTPLGSISYTISPNGQMVANSGGGGSTSLSGTQNSGGPVAAGTNAQGNSVGVPWAYNSANPNAIAPPAGTNYGVVNGSGGSQSSGFGLGGNSASGNGVPSVTSNITLNPEVQQALDLSLQTKAGEGQTALSYLDQVNKGLANGAPTPDAAFQKAQMDNMTALQAPFVAQQQEQLRAELAAKGVTEGSPAWESAMRDESNSLNNQQQQNIANATGQEQAQLGMQQSAYTMPLNELSALQSGSQVQQPSFNAPSPVSVNPTNTAANAYSSYNGQVANANASTASSNSLMSSLFGLGGSLGSAYMMAPAAGGMGAIGTAALASLGL